MYVCVEEEGVVLLRMGLQGCVAGGDCSWTTVLTIQWRCIFNIVTRMRLQMTEMR